jgi:hypothetical protein
MSLWEKVRHSNFIIRLTSWEYWPFGIVQLPLFIYWFWLSLKARSIFFFSASNPGIVMGGMFGESKFEVIRKIPSHYIPATILVEANTSKSEVLHLLHENKFFFPVIFKPDLGERGYLVKKINSEREIDDYLQHGVNFLIQKFVSLPLEFGVFYTRFPNEDSGKVTSIVMKEMLSVTGNGSSTLEHLILKKDRAKLQWKKLKETYADRLHEVVPKGQSIELVSIGNHALGTVFRDGSHLINEKLSETFDQISKQVDGFFFGRFDLRCASIDDLYEGKIAIMELNGCGAEPAHIYEPGYSLIKAIGVLFRHWRNIYLVASQNHSRGVPYISFKEGVTYYRKFKAAIR